MTGTINRKYKDTIFRMLFKEKEELLSLYNAIGGTNYSNPDDLDINTLEDVIYMGMKNDLSFIIDGRLSLYEHQSTWNGNMPLRNLLYVSNLYSRITSDKDIYGSATIELQEPNFIVFYNGSKEIDDVTYHYLSDAFNKKSKRLYLQKNDKYSVYDTNEYRPKLELEVTVLNINEGHNLDLMSKCKTLYEYASYIHTVREYSKIMPIEEAVDMAIDECIKNNILAEFLRNYRAEVFHMSIFEYDAQKHIETVRSEAKAEGREEGRKEGRAEGKAEGREEGKSQTMANVIKRMYEEKIPFDVIGAVTQTSPEEIKKIIESFEI